MTNIECYAKIIDDIFGEGKVTFSLASKENNNVIGALNAPDNFSVFIKNFINRLKRLQKKYENYPEDLKNLLVQVNEISSSKNWAGAFAELCAYDYFNTLLENVTSCVEPIKLNVSLDKNNSLALECGKKETNLDGVIKSIALNFDVKALKDNVAEILEGIYKDFRTYLYKNPYNEKNQQKQIIIVAECEKDISYETFKSKRQELLKELKEEINFITQKTKLKSKVLPNLTYEISWKRNELFTENEYNPLIHADNLHKTIFNYANKFLKNEPSVIVFVIFPWYNQIIKSFSDSNSLFYKELAKQFFEGYKYNMDAFNTFNTEFTGNHSLFEISQHLSGIIFLEDNSILNMNENNIIKSFGFINPNAINKIQIDDIKLKNLLFNS